jgi:Zn-dependent protease
MLGGDITGYLFTLSIFLPSLSVHECAHGWVAYRFGDDTAARMGRLTLNPIAHISLFGTIILPLIAHFGWAKPVPVNFGVLNKGQIFLVAAAGPASNLLLAVLLTVLFHALGLGINTLLGIFVAQAILCNVILAMFNLIPIPPLDGSKMVYASLRSPEAVSAYGHFARYGIFVLIGLIWLGGLDRILWNSLIRLSALIRIPFPF